MAFPLLRNNVLNVRVMVNAVVHMEISPDYLCDFPNHLLLMHEVLIHVSVLSSLQQEWWLWLEETLHQKHSQATGDAASGFANPPDGIAFPALENGVLNVEVMVNTVIHMNVSPDHV